MTRPHIDTLREHLLDTLAALRDRQNPMDPDRARAIAQVAGELVNSAKVEVEFLRVTGGDQSTFIGRPERALPAPADNTMPTAHNPFPGMRRHRLEG